MLLLLFSINNGTYYFRLQSIITIIVVQLIFISIGKGSFFM